MELIPLTPETEHEMLTWLGKAADSEYGIWLEFESPEALRLYRAKLYTARKGIERFRQLSFCEVDNKLYLMKREVEVEIDL